MRFDLRLLGGHPRKSGTRGAAFPMAREQGVLPIPHQSYSLQEDQLERSSYKRKRTTCNIAIFL